MWKYFRITYPDLSDYTCVARNGEGRIHHTVRVVIAGRIAYWHRYFSIERFHFLWLATFKLFLEVLVSTVVLVGNSLTEFRIFGKRKESTCKNFAPGPNFIKFLLNLKKEDG